MILTQHAAERGRERLSIPAPAVLKLADRAWERGLRSSEVSGSLMRFLNGRERQEACHVRVYGEYVYIYSPQEDRRLITVVPLPPRFRAQLRRMRG